MSLKINDKWLSRRRFARQASLVTAGTLVFPLIRVKGNIPASVIEHPAMFQQESARGVMCLICPNGCVLKDGEIGDCRSRVARKSKLYTMAYGNPCAINRDPVEKKPLFHFLPGSTTFSIATAGCNLACLNCQNWTISQTSPDMTSNYVLPPENVVREAKSNDCISISYTYSEPNTFYEYVFDTSRIAREKGIKNIMVSNGYINPEPLKLLCKYIDAANIDLKSFSDATYIKLNGGKLQPVLDSLKIYLDQGVWLEITNLIVPGWTDKPEEIKDMCKWLYANGFKDVPLHFSRFQPLYKLEHLPPTPVNILRTAAKIASAEGLNYIYIDNVPGSEKSDTICPKCGKKLVVRKGYNIEENNIVDNRCRCGTLIPGVWK
jgi:pyruvate formate lyase activating enzyme